MIAEVLVPFRVDEAEIGLDAMAEVGPGRHHFATAHTLERYETAFYRPILSDWRNFETWSEDGARTAARTSRRVLGSAWRSTSHRRSTRVRPRPASTAPVGAGAAARSRPASGAGRLVQRPLQSVDAAVEQHGWVIVAVTAAVLIATADVRSAPGAFLLSMRDEPGWSTASLSFVAAVGLIAYGHSGTDLRAAHGLDQESSA